MATKLVLEPIYEADFCPTSYGFRPGRRAQDAIEQVRFFIHAPRSYEWVIEGDVEDCFGQIHQGLLMEQVRRRVTDKRVLAADPTASSPPVSCRELGTVTATPSGTPQGSILSPLLANIALSVLDRRFEAAWTARTHNQRARDRANGLPSLSNDPLRGRLRRAGTRHRSPSPRDQGADGRVHARADALDALAREDTRHPRRRRLRPARVPHRAETLARPTSTSPTRSRANEQSARSCTASRR